jgi:hypothetical protein
VIIDERIGEVKKREKEKKKEKIVERSSSLICYHASPPINDIVE